MADVCVELGESSVRIRIEPEEPSASHPRGYLLDKVKHDLNIELLIEQSLCI